MKLAKLYLYTILLTSLAITGCKSKKTDDDLIIPASESYNKGLSLLKENKHSKASEEFGKIFFQHPGNNLTPQAELMQAYSLFLSGEYEEVADILDTFIKLHPMHTDIAYAYYLKALSYYMQISNIYLDQSKTNLAKQAFEDVIKRFPTTKYAIDSSLKIDLVNDHLAGKEMEVGRYYLKKNNPISAIARFQSIIKEYQSTSHAPEAIYRLVECHIMLGLNDEAKKYASVLGHNYPDSKWYKYAYELVIRTK